MADETESIKSIYKWYYDNFFNTNIGLDLNNLWVVSIATQEGDKNFLDVLKGEAARFDPNAISVDYYGKVNNIDNFPLVKMVDETWKNNTKQIPTGLNAPEWGSANVLIAVNKVALPSDQIKTKNVEMGNGYTWVPPMLADKHDPFVPLQLTFYYTTYPFSEFIIRPWAMAINRYGLKLRSTRAHITCTLFTKHNPLDKTTNWYPKFCYKFYSCYPLGVPQVDLTYDNDALDKSSTIQFGYDYYKLLIPDRRYAFWPGIDRTLDTMALPGVEEFNAKVWSGSEIAPSSDDMIEQRSFESMLNLQVVSTSKTESNLYDPSADVIIEASAEQIPVGIDDVFSASASAGSVPDDDMIEARSFENILNLQVVSTSHVASDLYEPSADSTYIGSAEQLSVGIDDILSVSASAGSVPDDDMIDQLAFESKLNMQVGSTSQMNSNLYDLNADSNFDVSTEPLSIAEDDMIDQLAFEGKLNMQVGSTSNVSSNLHSVNADEPTSAIAVSAADIGVDEFSKKKIDIKGSPLTNFVMKYFDEPIVVLSTNTKISVSGDEAKGDISVSAGKIDGDEPIAENVRLKTSFGTILTDLKLRFFDEPTGNMANLVELNVNPLDEPTYITYLHVFIDWLPLFDEKWLPFATSIPLPVNPFDEAFFVRSMPGFVNPRDEATDVRMRDVFVNPRDEAARVSSVLLPVSPRDEAATIASYLLDVNPFDEALDANARLLYVSVPDEALNANGLPIYVDPNDESDGGELYPLLVNPKDEPEDAGIMTIEIDPNDEGSGGDGAEGEVSPNDEPGAFDIDIVQIEGDEPNVGNGIEVDVDSGDEATGGVSSHVDVDADDEATGGEPVDGAVVDSGDESLGGTMDAAGAINGDESGMAKIEEIPVGDDEPVAVSVEEDISDDDIITIDFKPISLS